MESLELKLTTLFELLKALKSNKIDNSSSLPKIKGLDSIKAPNLINTRTKETKIPGVSPDAKKDPKKIAQQIKDGSMSTKTQKMMLKFDKNGQWSIIEQ